MKIYRPNEIKGQR